MKCSPLAYCRGLAGTAAAVAMFIIVPMVTPNCCSSSTTLKISRLLNALGAAEREPSAVVIALPAGKAS